MKIALDPAMYHAELSVADEVRKAAELGYECLELPPRRDFFFWHRYPEADEFVGIGHDTACWTDFLAALAEVDPNLAVNIEHEYTQTEGLALAAKNLRSAAAAR